MRNSVNRARMHRVRQNVANIFNVKLTVLNIGGGGAQTAAASTCLPIIPIISPFPFRQFAALFAY